MPHRPLPHRPTAKLRTPQRLAQTLGILWLRIGYRRALGVCLFILAGTFMVVQANSAQTIRRTYGQQREVYLASTDLVPGQILSDADLALQLWPIGLIPADAHLVSPVGQRVRHHIGAGAVLLEAATGLGELGLGPQQVALTLPQPFAVPPVVIGSQVLLVGVHSDTGFEANAIVLGRGEVLRASPEGLTISVSQSVGLQALEALAIGTVDILIAD